MHIQMYPSFDEVFADQKLYGIFYPLCTVTAVDLAAPIHFVSANGMWIDERFQTPDNTAEYTLFDNTSGRYQFAGDARLYEGYEVAAGLQAILAADFAENGADYLHNRTKLRAYAQTIKSRLPELNNSDLDLDYYIGTFYEYAITRLNYQLTGKFQTFNFLIDQWAQHESDIVYTTAQEPLETMINDGSAGLSDVHGYQFIGRTIGSEFFTDGNDTVLFYNSGIGKALALNSYS